MRAIRYVIVDDKKSLEGATSHDVRDRFIAWVAEELPRGISRKECRTRGIQHDRPPSRMDFYTTFVFLSMIFA
jgi:hypothetical protein